MAQVKLRKSDLKYQDRTIVCTAQLWNINLMLFRHLRVYLDSEMHVIVCAALLSVGTRKLRNRSIIMEGYEVMVERIQSPVTIRRQYNVKRHNNAQTANRVTVIILGLLIAKFL